MINSDGKFNLLGGCGCFLVTLVTSFIILMGTMIMIGNSSRSSGSVYYTEFGVGEKIWTYDLDDSGNQVPFKVTIIRILISEKEVLYVLLNENGEKSVRSKNTLFRSEFEMKKSVAL